MKVKLIPSKLKNKKWRMLFYDDGVLVEYTDFGHPDYQDYTIHHDENRKRLYLVRFQKLIKKNTNNPYSATTLSTMILWNQKSIKDSLNSYKKFFNFQQVFCFFLKTNKVIIFKKQLILVYDNKQTYYIQQ